MNESCFLLLAKLAKRYLCMAASMRVNACVNVCERVFKTSACCIVNARHNRLTAENIDMLTFWPKIGRTDNHICAYTRLVVTHGQMSEMF